MAHAFELGLTGDINARLLEGLAPLELAGGGTVSNLLDGPLPRELSLLLLLCHKCVASVIIMDGLLRHQG